MPFPAFNARPRALRLLTVAAAAAMAFAAVHAADFRNDGMASYEHGTFWKDSIKYGLILLAVLVTLFYVIHVQRRNRRRVADNQRRQANALRYMANHGVGDAEVAAAGRYFLAHPDIDAEQAVMSSQAFAKTLGPNLSSVFGPALTDIVHDLLFARNVIVTATEIERAKGRNWARFPSQSTGGGQPPPPQTADKPAKSARPAAAPEAEAIPFMHPGNSLRVVRTADGQGFTDVILSTSPDSLVVAMPDGAQVQPGDEVEVQVDVGLALCGLVAYVTEVSRARPLACQIGRFVEGWVIRRRQAMRVKLIRTFTFSVLPFDQTGKMQSMQEISARLTASYEGQLRDISYGGCALVTREKRKFNKGDLVRFSVELVAGSAPATLFGTVVHMAVKRHGDMEETSLHVQFLALDHASSEILTRALRQLMTSVG